METNTSSKAEEIFSGCEAGNKKDFNYISYANPNQVYDVTTSNLTKFWTAYCNAVQDGEHLMICEVLPKETPIFIKGTFLFKELSEEQNIYDILTQDVIGHMCYCAQVVTQESVKFNYKGENSDELTTVYLESESYNDEGMTKVDFRIQLPFCKIDTLAQKKGLRDRFVRRFVGEKIFDYFKEYVSGDPMEYWEKVVHHSYDDPLELFGSVDTIKQGRLGLRQIFNEIMHPHDIVGALVPQEKLHNIYWPAMHNHVVGGYINKKLFGDPTEDFDRYMIADRWLPMFLSVYFCNMACQVLPSVYDRASRNKKVIEGEDNFIYDGDFELCNSLLPMLSNERFTDRQSWLEIGQIMHNITEKNEMGWRKWKEYSDKAGVICDDDEYKTLYDTFANPPSLLTVRTIGFYARQDSIKKYNEWNHNWVGKALHIASTTMSDYDVGQVMYRSYWLDYITSGDLKHPLWYEFKNHKWHFIGDGIEIKKIMSTKFVRKFEIFRTELSKGNDETESALEKGVYDTIIGKVHKLIMKLKNQATKGTLLKEFYEAFYERLMVERLDSNPNLMGLPNGVMEVAGNNAFVRYGKPEDYISVSTEAKYDHSMHWGHEKVKMCMEWFRQTFRSEKLINYFLKYSASLLRAGNFNKLFMVFSGEGNNSKSMIKKLYELTFGKKYCWTFPTTLFTGKRTASGGCTPEIAGARYARLAFAVEPSKMDSLNSGTLKEFTGDDDMYVRGLYKEGGNMKIMFKFILLCNTIPNIPGYDQAVMRRFKVVPFNSTWSDVDVPETYEEQMKQGRFLEDPTFSTQIHSLSSAFLWILVQKYTDYMREGLNQPEEVNQYTEDYWKTNDTYTQFVSDNIEKTVKPDGKKDVKFKVEQHDLYTLYKVWNSKNGMGQHVPINMFLSEMNTRIGKVERGKPWRGYQLTQQARELFNNEIPVDVR
jgi:phage/plasmid-associated DNA primase